MTTVDEEVFILEKERPIEVSVDVGSLLKLARNLCILSSTPGPSYSGSGGSKAFRASIVTIPNKRVINTIPPSAMPMAAPTGTGGVA